MPRDMPGDLPGEVRSKRGRDGKAQARIDHAMARGARFESAWFGFPAEVGEPEMQALLDAVERGLVGGPGSRLLSRRASFRFGRPSLRLELELAGGRRGLWEVSFPTGASLLEMSAVGPAEGRWAQEVEAFFASLHVP